MSARFASCRMSCRNCGIRELTSSRIALPLTNEAPNLSPSPVNASAAAVNVMFSLTGSIFSEISVIVSNKVLNSVVTDVASITVSGLIRCGVGFLGVVNATYLLPNTVLAETLASTFAGINGMYFGSTSNVIVAVGCPSCWVSSTLETRPIATPLYVTFEPGSITKPARAANIVSFVFGVNSPRNCIYTNTNTTVTTISAISPAGFFRDLRGAFSLAWGAVIGGYTVRLKLGLVP